MLSLRRLLLVGCVALGLVAAPMAVRATEPNTPSDGTPGSSQCQLDGLSFTNGLKISPSFNPYIYHYTCSCDSLTAGQEFSTVVRPHMYDSGSSAEITFNGRHINFRDMDNAISNLQNVAASPRAQSDVLTFKTGTNTIIVGVGCNGLGMPVPCYYQYFITCDKAGKPDVPVIVGDPQFVGLRGQNYQVHGVAGEIYNIVSDSELQYNSRFVFLSKGECPVVNGRKQKSCWSHPGSYLGELGLKTKSGDRIHLITGNAKEGFESVTVNDKEVLVGETVLLADNAGSVSRNSTHLASVQVGNWDFAFENSDMFVNQRVRVLDSRALRSHGLLGQTWREATYPNAIKYIQGTVDDYVIRDNDIFGDNFVFNAFN